MSDEQSSVEQMRNQAALLLTQARAQSQDIHRAMRIAGGDAALSSRLSSSAAQLAAVEGRLALAVSSPSFSLSQTDLLALGGAIHASEVSSLVSEAVAQASAGSPMAVAQAAAASIETRRETEALSRDMFDRKIFDPYLHFSSAEDEAEYRKRQAEARSYVNAQLARGTPEGNLNAGGGMVGSMLDAHAHGAGDSPEFLPRWNALTERTQRQRAAMQAAGQSTEEYDRMLNANVRRFLEAKGLPAAEIDRRLAGNANPLEAVKPFMANGRATRDLNSMIDQPVTGAASLPETRTVAEAPAAVPDAPSTLNFDAMAAKLKAAGIVMGEPGEAAGHGLSIQKPAAPAQAIGG